MDPVTATELIAFAKTFGVWTTLALLLGWGLWRLASDLKDAHIRQLEKAGTAMEKTADAVVEQSKTSTKILGQVDLLHDKADEHSQRLERIAEAIPALCRGKVRESS